MKILLPTTEAARLEALRQYQILDTSPEEAFDDLTCLAGQICQTPMAFITLVDHNRQWFKSKVGADVTEAPLDVGFCPFVVQKRDILIIPDALADQQFAVNPAVTANLSVRFYAGVPLTTDDGHIMGTICVIDGVPRELSQKQINALRALSRQVVIQLELRRSLIEQVRISAERQEAEEALRKSNEFLRRMIVSSADCIKVLDLDTRLLSMNSEGLLLLEIDDFTPYKNLSWFDFWQEADKQAVCSAVATAKAGGVGRFQGYCPTAKGKPKWWDVVVTPIMNAEGKPENLLAVSRDITERKQAEEDRTRLARLVEESSDFIGIATLEGKVIFLNEAGQKLVGLEGIEEVKRMALSDYFTPEDLVYFQQKIIPFVMKHGRWEGEFRFRHFKTDVLIPVHYNFFTIKDRETGQPISLATVSRDMTERKQAEEALQQLNTNLECQVQERTAQLQQSLKFEATLKRITDKVRDSLDERQILQVAVQELALVLGVICCNAALYDLNQDTSTVYYAYVSSYAGTTMPSFAPHVVQMADFLEDYSQLLQGKYFQFCVTDALVRNQVSILACPIFDAQGTLGDLRLFNHRDYTFNELEIRLVQQVANQGAIAIRQARLYQAATAQVEELAKLNSLKDDFLSTVSHELRTPIANMKMALQMLKDFPTAERRERYLDILQAECARENDLINDLLDLQRLETASSPISLVESVSLQDWLPSVIEPFRSRIQEHQQTLQVNLSPDLPPLLSDYASLGRIFAELFNNACKYTPAGGQIALSTHYDSQSLTLTSDPAPVTIFTIVNSAEIPATGLPHIFEKFYRVPNANPWKQNGTGLGLALVQKLVEQLQGTILVESSKGYTTFTIQLPNQPKA